MINGRPAIYKQGIHMLRGVRSMSVIDCRLSVELFHPGGGSVWLIGRLPRRGRQGIWIGGAIRK